MEAIASSLNTTARTRHAAAWISSPAEARPPNFRAISGGNWPRFRQPLGQPGRGVQPGVGGPGGGEQGGDAHQPVARLAERGLGGHGQRGPPEAITFSTVSVPNTPSAMAT